MYQSHAVCTVADELSLLILCDPCFASSDGLSRIAALLEALRDSLQPARSRHCPRVGGVLQSRLWDIA
eukprot:1595978-Pyramimonas_sp.AAC.2